MKPVEKKIELSKSKGHIHYWLPVKNGGWACNCGVVKDFGKYNKFSHILGPPPETLLEEDK